MRSDTFIMLARKERLDDDPATGRYLRDRHACERAASAQSDGTVKVLVEALSA